LGVREQLGAAEPPFQELLPAPPCLGTWLGTAREPRGGFTHPHWRWAMRRGGRRDALQTKASQGLVPARGRRQHGVCHRSDGVSCPHLCRSLISPHHLGKPWGAEKRPGSCPSVCAGSPSHGAFPAPTGEPGLGARDQHSIAARGQNHIGITPFSAWFHPAIWGRSPLGPPTPAPRVPVPALLSITLRGPNPSREQAQGKGSLGSRGCQPHPGLPHCRERAPTSPSHPMAAPCSPSSSAPDSRRPRECRRLWGRRLKPGGGSKCAESDGNFLD